MTSTTILVSPSKSRMLLVPGTCSSPGLPLIDSFGKFRFYLDEQAYPTSPNKYKARMVENGWRFSDGHASPDVEFRQVEGVEPPDPQFLRVHAAFAKVLNLCGAAEYVEIVERDAESATTLRIDGTTDFGTLLMSRLPIAAD
ncbi:hypothetical protein DFH09DRAFT_1335162 [Mycena vulgaris]|nr:hypothetical protein DFH09DRAFT_1335162 [Mycena vulgaris]